jgi:hypothetical protein
MRRAILLRSIITLFILSLLCFSAIAQGEKPLVEILEFRYEKDRLAVQQQVASGPTTPARAVTRENKYFERKAREQLSPGAQDPNTMTVDGRRAELDRITREANSRPRKNVEGYSYHAKIANSYSQPIEIVFWEVKFTTGTDQKNIVRRQFICPVKVKSGETRELSVFITLGPSEVVDAAAPAAAIKAEPAVSRVEFADGAVWQRLDWHYADEKEKIKTSISTPWASEMCRGF